MILVIVSVEFRKAEPAEFELTSCTLHELTAFCSDDHHVAVRTRLGIECHVEVTECILIVESVQNSRIRIHALPLRITFSTLQIVFAAIASNETNVLAL